MLIIDRKVDQGVNIYVDKTYIGRLFVSSINHNEIVLGFGNKRFVRKINHFLYLKDERLGRIMIMDRKYGFERVRLGFQLSPRVTIVREEIDDRGEI